MNSSKNPDELFLKEALKLAEKGLGVTLPNPMVGAVIVKEGRIISQGFHKRAGLPHAEIEALSSTDQSVEGATLYVNLEPCSHYGKTPPCSEAIIKSGINRVVCSTLDPNPKVSGEGVKNLRKAGIEVEVGLLKEEAKKLNEVFFGFHKNKRPFIALKFASSLDGKIATSSYDSKWITGKKSLEYSHKLRRQYQSVLIGVNTLLYDNPNLGSYSKSKPDPLRIILDPKLKTPLNSRALRNKNVIIATTKLADRQKLGKLQDLGFEVLVFNSEIIPLRKLVKILAGKEILSILVEGGGKTLGNFIDENLFDKLYAFYAPIIIGGEKAISPVAGKGVELVSLAKKFQIESFKKTGDDFLVTASPKHHEI